MSSKYYLFKWWLSRPLPIETIIKRLGLKYVRVLDNGDVVGTYYDSKGEKYRVMVHISWGEPSAVEKIRVYINKRLTSEEEDRLSDEMIEKIERKKIERIMAEREELKVIPPTMYSVMDFLLKEFASNRPIIMVRCERCNRVAIIPTDIYPYYMKKWKVGDVIERYCIKCNRRTKHIVIGVGEAGW